MTQSPAKKSFFNRNVDLMNGPIFKSLLIFMLPILVSCLFQQLYNTVDTMIVGNVLGDTALAAIGACGAIYELLVGFGIGIGNGLAIVAAPPPTKIFSLGRFCGCLHRKSVIFTISVYTILSYIYKIKSSAIFVKSKLFLLFGVSHCP